MRRFLAWLTVAFLFPGAACERGRESGVAVESKFRAAIPSNVQIMAQLDASQLRKSNFYTRHRADLDVPLVNAAAERLGFDPRKDLSTIFYAANSPNYLVLAQGHWNRQALARNMSVRFLPNGVAALGSPAAVETAQANNSQMPSEFPPLLAGLPGSAQLWLASREGLPFTDLITRSDISSALANITPDIAQASAAITFDSGAHVAINLVCFAGVSEMRVYEGLRAGLAVARIASGQDAELYGTVRIQKNGSTVEVRADLTAPQVDELLLTASNFRLR